VVQDAIRKSGYDIVKARNKLLLYFENRVWLAIAPFIYVKKNDGRPARMLPENAGSSQVPIRPEDYGLTLSPQARQLIAELGTGNNDRMGLVFELKDALMARGAPVDWESAEAVMNFLNTFSVNAYFYCAKEKRNDVAQDILAGRLERALQSIAKLDEHYQGLALCWAIMERLNAGEVDTARKLIKKVEKTGRWDYLVKATGLVAMYYVKNGIGDEAEGLFGSIEKELDNGFGLDLLVEWQKRAGLENLAIRTMLDHARGCARQDQLFELIAKTKAFEIRPEDFEIR
jgi:hypothetical protein